MKGNHTRKAPSRALAIFLILAMCISALGMTPAEAKEETDPMELLGGAAGTVTITAFDELEEDVSAQRVPQNTAVKELNLPEELNATDGAGADLTVTGVTWESEPEYDGGMPGTYILTAVLPEGYEPDTDMELPQISVTVEDAEDAETTEVTEDAETTDETEDAETSETEPQTDDAHTAEYPDIIAMATGILAFSNGDGTAEYPYIITTAAQLDEVRGNLTAHYKLGNDINLTAYLASGTLGWQPIGTAAIPFTGTFDGAGYKITGLWINRADAGYIGLFGYTGDAVIKNLGVEIDDGKGSVKGLSNTGGLVGYQRGGGISGCYINGGVDGGGYTGGLVGYLSDGSITSSYASGTVNGTRGTGRAGGLVGNQTGGSIVSSYATGSVDGFSYVGGLVGYQLGGSIENSYASGSVTGKGAWFGGLVGVQDSGGSIKNSYASGNVKGITDLVNNAHGGLVGYQTSNSRIENSCAIGNVESNSYTGGLVGQQNNGSTITDSYASGSVTGVTGGSSVVGGLVGYQNVNNSITNCYATGSVYGRSTTGGLAGYQHGRIENSYARGSVTSNIPTNAGGLVGNRGNDASITSCYYDSEATGRSYAVASGSSTGVTSLTTGQMTAANVLAGNMSGLGTNWTQRSDPTTCCGSVSYYPELRAFVDSGNAIMRTMSRQSAIGAKPSTCPDDEELFFEGGTLYIYTAEQMNHVRRHKERDFLLCANISLARYSDGQGWVPIPEYSGFFDGNNGNGYSISNLRVNRGTTNRVGLFEAIGSTGTVHGLTVKNSEVGGNDFTGGIAGYNSGTIQYCHYTGAVWSGGNCAGGITGHNAGTVTACSHTGDITAKSHIGGIAGQNNWIVEKCTNYAGEIWMDYAAGTSLGGIVGYNEAGYISECFNYAQINSRYNTDNTANTGGITGTNYAGVYNCRNYGVVQSYGTAGGIVGLNYNLTGVCTNEGAVVASCPGGGIAGYNQGNGTVNDCTNSGSVTGNLAGGNRDSYHIGGAVGYNNAGTVKSCHNTGAVTGRDDPAGGYSSAGGLVGYNESGAVTESDNAGAVSAPGSDYVGGVVGRGYGGSVGKSYNTAAVTGNVGAGGVVGNNHIGTIEYCYNTGAVGAQRHAGGITGWNDAGIACCYNTGSVTAASRNAGGLVGENAVDTIYTGTIQSSYSAGTVSGTQYVGGFAGSNDGTITDCFYNSGLYAGDATGGGSGSSGVTGVGTAQMLAADTLGIGGAMSALGTANWSKRADNTDYRYYPELAVFYGGTGAQQAASEKSARVVSVKQSVGNISAPNPITAGQALTPIAPTVTPGTEIITGRGWQLSAGGASGWTEYAGGTLDFSFNGYFLRYYAASASDTVYSNTVTITVNKAMPVIHTQPTASAVWKGAALSTSALTGGGADVPGGFSWTAPGTAVNASGMFGVTFTPTDATNYNTVITTVSVTAVDKDALDGLITTASGLKNAAVIGAGNGQYTQAAVDIFASAITAAQGITTAAPTTQTDVNNALDALQAAIDIFNGAANTVDTDALERAITDAKAVKRGAYTVDSWNALQAAISDGEELLVKQYVTQTELDDGENAIRDAMAALEAVPAADALKELIEEAQKRIDSLKPEDIGTGHGQYPQDEIDKLQDAIDKAWDILDDPESSEADLLEAIADLQKAIDDFRESRISVDFSALKEAIAKAEALKQEDYTKATWDALPTALTNAKALVDKKGVTQAEIDAAAKALTDALNALVRIYRFTSGFSDFTGAGDLTGTIDAPYPEFIRLLINGVEVDSSSYTAAAGSTVITLKEAYLKTLKNGTYTVTAVFEGGYAETTLKVVVKAAVSNSASTGDNSNAWLWTAMGASILGIAGIALIREKKLFGGKRRT